ncbi:hypothetical protein [Streptomyces sp. AP-93]|uniref:hypothetical protein n=1 Tax=Streptomyces sp. AP-93 TaxID=2929048 RepID=UPI001FAF5385|nr:hypothetical protein [Streptomyces sp. AP-93]MCJ0868061.1 hypothetical protein [Streptomyces sp. AP-93]
MASSTRSHRATVTRWTRPVGKSEKCVEVSSHARAELSANRFKVYGFIRLENDFETEPSPKEIGKALRLTSETVRRILVDLRTEGWVSKTEGGGGRGNEARYTAHDFPVIRITQLALFPQPQQVKVVASEAAEDLADEMFPGQMRLFDCPGNPLDLLAETPLDPAVANPLDPAVQKKPSFDQALFDDAGEVDGGSARRALQVVARGPVENPATETFSQAVAEVDTASPEAPKKSPTTISATAYRVLRLLPLELSPGQYGLAAKAIEQAVAQVGGDVERITDRVHRNLAGPQVTDPYGWIISRGLRNSPCPETACEDGRTWPTGADCPICRERYADRRGTPLVFRDRATAIYEVTWICTKCERPGPGEPPADAICRVCCPDVARVGPSPYLAEDVRGHAAAVRSGIRHKATAEQDHDALAIAREQKRARRLELDEQRRPGDTA